MMQLIDRILVRRDIAVEEDDEKPFVNDDEPQVIVVGFGRFGQVIGRLLMANKTRITVLERDISVVSLMRSYGYKVYYGDATELELLRAAGALKRMSYCGPAYRDFHVKRSPARWRWGARCCNRWVCIRIRPTGRSNTSAGWICVCCVN